MIEWVFLDVGSVIYNDAPQTYAVFRHYFDAIRRVQPDYSFNQLLADREQLVRQQQIWVLHKIASRWLPKEEVDRLYWDLREELLPKFDNVHLPMVGLAETLGDLRREYRLGVIANQPAECRASLDRRGMLELFEIVGISEELNLFKPDPELYRWAIERSGVDPARAVMIGDRIDNDVLPARSLGMRTILYRSDPRREWNPADAEAQAFLQSWERTPIFPVGDETNAPDEVAGAMAALPELICSMT
ncbi:Pyrimidine 5'-nucleotidase YjjG [Planctomycetes bacterium Pan216]|uniref:Pyrimidine 5'-nucleotidase YjjG n=1 Tax=Kolteria novifilia TaxID=2527975 RepID=A0A518B742_9BACT|nr:Pyrimidine 5'-nucleotidase YjjG [Planctomycetes bacterium Pan216]